MAQQDYIRELQDRFDATRRVPTYEPGADPEPDLIAALKDLDALHRSGALSDEEFTAAKAKALGAGADES
jgi:hypothetical protein